MVSAFGGLTVVLSVVDPRRIVEPAPGVRCGGRDGRCAADRARLRWRAARDPVRRPGRRLRPRRARALLAHGDHHRRGARDDVLDPDLHDRPGRERVDRDRGRAASWRGARGARSGIDPRAVPPGRTRASSGRSCSSESSTSWDSSPSRSGSRPLRPGWSGWRRRSVRRSRSSSPSRSSASDSDRSSGSGSLGILTGMVWIAVP